MEAPCLREGGVQHQRLESFGFRTAEGGRAGWGGLASWAGLEGLLSFFAVFLELKIENNFNAF